MADNVRTHVTWSIETPDGKCPFCRTETLFVVCRGCWETVEDQVDHAGNPILIPPAFRDGVEVHDEVSGHWCGKCEKLVSLSLNTIP